MTLIAIAAIYFAIQLKKISWSIISVGQIILLLTYPTMLGGYPNTSVELAKMTNEIATIVFVFGNIFFFSGLLFLYTADSLLKTWIKWLAIVLSGLMALVFLQIFCGFFTWTEALFIAPLANITYVINAYYGLKLKVKTEEK